MRKKIMMKIVATNVVASQPPERRPTATPTARANCVQFGIIFFYSSSGLNPIKKVLNMNNFVIFKVFFT